MVDLENPQIGANILHVSLTVPQLCLFEVGIGRNANFQILVVKQWRSQDFFTGGA